MAKTDETTVTLSSGGKSVTMSADKFTQAAKALRGSPSKEKPKGAAKGKTYQEADRVIVKTIRDTMEAHHPELVSAGVTVQAVVAYDTNNPTSAVKLHGYPCCAIVKKTSTERRARGAADVEITIDGAWWEKAHEAERVAVIDHELEHVEVTSDKLDTQGRPKLGMRLHNWQLGGFTSIAKRHKEAAVEVQAVTKFITSEDGQMVMEFGAAVG